MPFACWITKATDTHSECVTLIAFQSNNSQANIAYLLLIGTNQAINTDKQLRAEEGNATPDVQNKKISEKKAGGDGIGDKE